MKSNFLKMDIIQIVNLLDQLSPTSKPQWGIMTAQRMVEHLTDSIKISSGKLVLPLEIPEEKIMQMQGILDSDKELPKNFMATFAKEKAALRHEELALAIDELVLEWIDFKEMFSAEPDSTPIHPYYGPLNEAQWTRLHAKHFTHHFKQFGLISA